MQFCILFYYKNYNSNSNSTMFMRTDLLPRFLFQNYTAEISNRQDSTRRIPVLQCIQFPHVVHRVKKQLSTRLLQVYKSTHKKTPSSWRIYKYSTERKSSNLLLNWNKDSTIRSLHTIGISLGQFEFYVYRNYILQ